MLQYIAIGLAAYLGAVLFFLALFVAAAQGDRLWESLRPGARVPLHRKLVRRRQARPIREEGREGAN